MHAASGIFHRLIARRAHRRGKAAVRDHFCTITLIDVQNEAKPSRRRASC